MRPCSWSTRSTRASGAQIESYAKSRGVKVIDYDRLTLGGSRAYYVSFNNVKVGQLIGQGLVTCESAWHVKKPQVVVMHGAVTDNNATLFAQGYDSVINPYFKDGKWTVVAHTAGTWDPPTAETEFQAIYTAHQNVNSVLIPNDETGAPIITYLQSLHVKPKTFPTTGQDATLTGLQNVLSGYQCGTAYKPIYLEAQSAVALALYLRAGVKPPAVTGERHPRGHDVERQGPVGARCARVGHDGEHEAHDRQGQLRPDLAVVRRPVRQRLQRRRHLAVAIVGPTGLVGSVGPTSDSPADPRSGPGRGSVTGCDRSEPTATGGANMTDGTPLLELRGVSKAFGACRR